MKQTEEYLINVFNETRKISNSRFKEASEVLKKNTVAYSNLCSEIKHSGNTPVEFMEGGTVSTGYKHAKNYHTTILNFADALVPGGYPDYGASTQEENICRCTNMYETLITKKSKDLYYQVNREATPIGYERNGIYTDTVLYLPKVTVFRDDTTYAILSPRQFDVITCPAPSARFKYEQDAYNVYVQRIEQILLSAIKNNTECIILGAWGCGAFCQDPRLISKAFVQVLNQYAGAFKKIVFAIKATPNWHTTNSTAYIFLEVFENNYKYEVIDKLNK